VLLWLNDNSSALSAFSGLISAVATVVIVGLTFYLALENRRLRKIGSEPEVIAYIKPSPHEFIAIEMVFANVGNGPAKNVCVSFEADFENVALHEIRNVTKQKRKLLAAMPPSEKFNLLFGVGHRLFLDGKAMKPIVAVVSYQNIQGKSKEARFDLAVDTWANMSGPTTSPEVEFLREFKKFSAQTSSELSKISSVFQSKKNRKD
jgi:hypothetical protein